MRTPRTAQLLTRIFDRDGSVGPHNCPEAWVALCRELETELTPLTARDPQELVEALRGTVKSIETEFGEGNWRTEKARDALAKWEATR